MDHSYHLHFQGPGDDNHQHRQGSPHTIYHGYRQITSSAMEGGPQTQRASTGGTNLPRMPTSTSPRHVRQGSMRSLQSSPRMLQSSPRFQRTGTPTSSVGRAAYSMSPPPLLDSVSRSGQRTVESHLIDDPALPSRDVTDHNIDDAYVKFILYANPGVPQDADTTELRRVFRAPPRSDGKIFSVYTLWQLIKKLDNKELKTWSQLAIELGVEPPAAEKGQSAQKIQQYAVRLKRWMRAMHVDAFFEFCLGKAHRYYTDLPTAAANASEEGRDGVPLEEDLALRALVPQWRPKRGRKKNEDKEPDTAHEQPAAKRPHLESNQPTMEYEGLGMHSGIFPGNPAPWSAYPDEMNQEAWNMASAIPQSQNLPANVNSHMFHGRTGFDFARWRRDVSPAGYPQSAITLGHRQPETVINEPQSAITPSSSAKNKSQARRRHGPAVSSAWHSKGSSVGAKPRGRPPAVKHTQEDPPATILPGRSEEQAHSMENSQPGPVVATGAQPLPSQQYQSRPSKLQLQVPDRPGGPIRLATPPLVIVNGGGRLRRDSADYFRNPKGEDETSEVDVSQQQQKRHDNDFNLEDVARAFATRLLRIKIIGRPTGLSVDEANMVATKAVLSICDDGSGNGTRSSRPMAIKGAIILGVEKEMSISGTGSADHESHLSVRSVFQNADGSVSRSRRAPSKSTGNGTSGTYNYTISIDTTSSSGTFSSNIQIRDLIVPAQITANNDIDDEMSSLREQIKSLCEVPASAIEPPTATNGNEHYTDHAWHQRLLDVRRDEKVAEEKLRRLKRLMLEVVMGSE